MTIPFDFTPLLPAGQPPTAARWTGRLKYDFTGGNNDPDALPLDKSRVRSSEVTFGCPCAATSGRAAENKCSEN